MWTRRICPSSSAATPPLPPDDTSGTASADYLGRTRHHPPRPAECGPRPIEIFAQSRCASPTSPAPQSVPRPCCVSARGTPSPCRRRTPRTRPYRADIPGPADTPGPIAAATHARSNPSRRSAAASPRSPTGTIGTAAAHSVRAATPCGLRLPPRPVSAPGALCSLDASPLQRIRPSARSARTWCSPWYSRSFRSPSRHSFQASFQTRPAPHNSVCRR